MKSIFICIMIFAFATVNAQTKMYINKTSGGTDSIELHMIKSITFKIAPVIPTDGLIVWYPFNGNANDSTINGNHADSVKNVTLVSDRFGVSGKAYSFNGSNSYLNVPLSNSLKIHNDITVCVWIKSNVKLINKAIVEKYYGTQSDHGWLIETNVQGNILFEGRDGRGGATTITSLVLFPSDDKWHLVVGQRMGNIWRVFMDGKLESSMDIGGAAGSIESNGSLRIGASNNNGTISQYFNGSLDDIRIYNRALTENEILVLFNETIY
ncbi:MAG: LamG domain-containing protein [Bacteroidota bacterium]